MRPKGVADAHTVEIRSAKRFKQRDTWKERNPGDGSPGRKGPKNSREVRVDQGEKSSVYIFGARTANRHR